MPLAVGAASDAEVAAGARAARGPETLIVVSTDLSHYHDYETARRIDRRDVGRDRGAARRGDRRERRLRARAAARAARLARARGLGRRRSTCATRATPPGRTSGSSATVPMPSPEPASGLGAAERRALLDARPRRDRRRPRRAAGWAPTSLACPRRSRAPGASFVTLHRRGELRGCIGSLEPHRPLAEDVAGNARAAAYLDPRFAAVAREELPELELEISVLSPLAPLPAASESELVASLRPGVDGLVLVEGARRATFLPAVWRSAPRAAPVPRPPEAQGRAAGRPLVAGDPLPPLHGRRIPLSRSRAAPAAQASSADGP